MGIAHATVRHGQPVKCEREWARDDDGKGMREAHCFECVWNVALWLSRSMRRFTPATKPPIRLLPACPLPPGVSAFAGFRLTLHILAQPGNRAAREPVGHIGNSRDA